MCQHINNCLLSSEIVVTDFMRSYFSLTVLFVYFMLFLFAVFAHFAGLLMVANTKLFSLCIMSVRSLRRAWAEA